LVLEIKTMLLHVMNASLARLDQVTQIYPIT